MNNHHDHTDAHKRIGKIEYREGITSENKRKKIYNVIIGKPVDKIPYRSRDNQDNGYF